MQLIAFFCTLVTTVAATLRGFVRPPVWPEIQAEFDAWKEQHNVKFLTEAEEIHRLNIFADNHLFIWEHNVKPDVTYKLGHNQFSHLTEDEFSKIYFGLQVSNGTDWWPVLKEDLGLTADAIPASVDWVVKGAVTGVKDQGQCGSCWSFSTTGAIEGAYFIKYGKLYSLSEQQLVDCDTVDSGCNGGLMDNAFAYVQKYGITTESAYPYTAVQGTCKSTTPVIPAGVVKGFVDVLPSGDENALAAAVAQQPVSVAIQANQLAFQFYSSGILTGTCGKRLDHGVLAVGYGTDGTTPYWKVKNSWGTGWGEGGYIRIQRGVDKCGIADSASMPILA
jgi:C1A family cysteine protease